MKERYLSAVVLSPDVDIMVDNNSAEKSVNVKSMPVMLAEPAPLGLIGLAIAALVLGVTDLGLVPASAKSLMIPWTLFLGATAQLIAGAIDYRRGNIFGATAFTTYSLLWYSVSLTLYITIFTEVNFNLKHYAWGLIGFLGFSLILTLASLLTNRVFIAILFFIDLAIAALAMHILWGTPESLVGLALIAVSACSFYGALAILVNNMTGKTVFDMGKPMWKP